MAHVLLANPRISDFALCDSLARVLLRRGKRVTVLAADPVQARFFSDHCNQVVLLPSRRVRRFGDPTIEPHAEREAKLAGLERDLRAVRAAEQHLASFADGMLRVLETLAPDLVITIHGRSGLDRLLHDTARIFGIATAHLGDGLIAGTMQRDLDGIDGDRSGRTWQSRAAAGEAPVDRALIDAGLAIALAGAAPQCGPPARAVFDPPWSLSVRAALTRARWRRERMRDGLAQWRDLTHGPSDEIATARFLPDKTPQAVVLLQDPSDPRVALDTDPPVPSARELVEAARTAIGALDVPSHLVVVAPRRDTAGSSELVATDGLEFAPPSSAACLAATASVVVTINHQAGFAGVLAGTPVLCFGRTRFAGGPLAARVEHGDVEAAIARALDTTNRAHRHAELTAILRDEHLWCDQARPDPNGLAGLAGWIEELLEKAAPPPPPVHYEPGPTWPGTEMELG